MVGAFAFCLLLLFQLAWCVDLIVDVSCGTDSCISGYTIDGQTNPSIMCNVGDTITFQVQATNNPFYIKTARTTGENDVWSQTLNNGQENGGRCNDDTKRATLYYQSSKTSAAGGTICVGKSCGATVCTNDVCWGDDVPTPLSAEKVADYLAILAGDFEWYLAGVDGVASFSWSSDWTSNSNGIWQADVVYVRTSTIEVSVENMIDALSEVIGAPASWFDIVIKSEGGLSKDTFATLFLSDPEGFSNSTLGGYVDILLFAGTVGSPNAPLRCLTSSVCQSRYYAYKKRYCYRYVYSNLVAKYSGDDHVREGQCVPGANPAWGSLSVDINGPRNGGSYKMQCDSECRYCKQEGSFQGDQCVCYLDLENPVDDGYAYYCISMRYASAHSLLPSLLGVFVALASVVVSVL